MREPDPRAPGDRRLILVTGASGFVGRHVVRKLCGEGLGLRLVGREASLAGVADGAGAETRLSNDLFAEDARWWQAACAGVDTVIHLAWYAEPGKYLFAEQNLDCLAGTLALAKGAVRAGVRRIVGVGTCFEYDLDAGDLSVETPLRPATPYAAAKVAAFQVLSQWLARKETAFLWARLFYLYGEGEAPGRLVTTLRARLAAGEPVDLTRGTQIRDYMDVRDAAELLVGAALSEAVGAFNVCSGAGVTVRALAEQIADEYGRRDLLNFGARPDNPVDPVRVVGVRTPVGG